MRLFPLLILSAVVSINGFLTSQAAADLVLGTISDFQDGTAQGWAGGTIVVNGDSGPDGVGDFALQLSNGGNGNRMAMHNLGVNGSISSLVREIQVDMFRAAGQGDAEMRLVLFSTLGDRWTSTNAQLVDDDGNWNTFRFSIDEADLTQVNGAGTYESLTNNLQRIMFRYDPGAPSSGGAGLNGSVSFDNIQAIPEPSSALLLLLGLTCCLRRKSKTA